MEKKKIALISICLNEPYWQFQKDMVESARKYFLPHHQVDFFTWTDMPQEFSYGCTIFPTEPTTWPMPTLMRYHLFLRQEEILKEYDYIFYCDSDMEFVSKIGDEILGDGLTMAQHPMYAIRREYIPPYEPNPSSSAHIKMLGRHTYTNGIPKFEPLYAAGGFQGGTSKSFIKAMWSMKRAIDDDFAHNYMAIWNDESHWNRYLYDNPPAVVLSPSYVYPDSLNKTYYQKIWGRNYVPKLVTITKKFSLTKEGAENIQTKIATL